MIKNIIEIARKIYGQNFYNTRMSKYLQLNRVTFQRLKTGEYAVQPYQVSMAEDLGNIPKFSISESAEYIMLHHNHFPHFFATIRPEGRHQGVSVKVDDFYVLHRIVWQSHAAEDEQDDLLIQAADWLRESGFLEELHDDLCEKHPHVCGEDFSA